MRNAVRTLVIMGVVSQAAMVGVKAQPNVLEMEAAQTVVLDPANWDTAFVGDLYFDALRPLLVRFPGVAGQVSERLDQGQAVESVTLHLQWERTEGARPERGRHGWGAEGAYEANPGKWSVVVWPLRKPWTAEPAEHAPTFNAAIPGAVYWHQGGARRQSRDVGPGRFGPVPLHVDSPSAGIDLTSLLTDDAYGSDLARRLRALDDNGVLLLKDELYDLKYRGGASYDWIRSTGYMRIWIATPVLRIAFTPAEARQIALPPAADISVLATDPPAERGADSPSIYVPENLDELAERFAAEPEWAEHWQVERLRELYDIGMLEAARANPGSMRGVGADALSIFRYNLLSADPVRYRELIKAFMTMEPRRFIGHPTSDFAVIPILWGDAFSPGVLDHFRLYWEAFVHPEVEDPQKLRHGDTWRNYFRGYCLVLSTQNFNSNSIAATLLAGQFLDAPLVINDARWGLEHILMRTYAGYDGAYQELGETYYLALTLGGAAIINRWAEEPFDRLLGKMTRDRLMEPLISAYHPGLRRIVHPQCRGNIPNQILFQDGPYHALHTLSAQGAMLHLDDVARHLTSGARGHAQIHGIPVLGSEAPPDRSALFAPWGEAHLAGMVDAKPLPWVTRARHWEREPQSTEPGWHVNYLSEHFGLASREDGSVAPVVAHWRRGDGQVDHMEDVSTLMLSSGYNEEFMHSTGFWGTLQHDNKVLTLRVLREPHGGWMREGQDIASLHASIGIFAFGDTADREVWINDRKMDALSGNGEGTTDGWQRRMRTGGNVVSARDGDLILVNDGLTYIGIIPISANAGTRSHDVQISLQKPLLLVHSYMYRDEQPLDRDAFFGAERKATAGFVIEMGDRSQFASFADFRAHMRAVSLEQSWNSEQETLGVAYTSGDDALAMDFRPQVHRYATPHAMGPKPESRGINGAWPPLPEGIHRETPWSVQGMNGVITKNGTTLQAEEGRRIYLRTASNTAIITAYNLLPDPTFWSLSMPGGMRIDADGRVGLTRIEVNADENTVHIEHALHPDEPRGVALASAFLIFGAPNAPDAKLNGKRVEQPLASVQIDGEAAWVVPLADAVALDLAARHARARRRLSPDVRQQTVESLVAQWHIAGPFEPGEDGDGLGVTYPPDERVDLTAAYTGKDGVDVRWQAVDAGNENMTTAEPVDLIGFFPDETDVLGYAVSTVHSDAGRDAVLYFGMVDFDRVYTGWTLEPFELYLNGERIFAGNAHETPGRDGWQVRADLQQGANEVLVKFRRSRSRGWNFAFRVADEYGIPFDQGIQRRQP